MKFPSLYRLMLKRLHILCQLLLVSVIFGQEVTLPPDLRQANLTQFNSSLLNPVFSLDRNKPQSLALWTRWQWQSIDADPTTLFLNYTHQFNANSAGGIGFFQNNTGVFLQTGGVLNYAYAFRINTDFHIALGLNVMGYQQELADNRFQPFPNQDLPFLNEGPQFILQAAPGIQLGYKGFSIGFSGENFIDFNVSAGEKVSDFKDKVYLGLASYQIPIEGAGILEGSFLRPALYFKTIPNLDSQYGIQTLFSTERFWLQAGYNNFYGISGGIGGTFFQKFSVGALLEVGTSKELEGKDPSFEIITAFHFGAPDTGKKVVGFDVEEDTLVPVPEPKEVPKKQLETQRAPKEKKVSRKERKALELAAAQRVQDSVAAVRAEQLLEETRKREIQKSQDSIAALRLREAEEAKKQAIEDAPRQGERYEEAVIGEDIRPGYYIIVNVFRTQRYYTSFMKTLKDKGLAPKSFYRTERKLNYVYLERYDTMQEARKARDNKFGGRYQEIIWIFRVKPE